MNGFVEKSWDLIFKHFFQSCLSSLFLR